MSKVTVEFINTCACCDEHGANIKKIAEPYGKDVEVSIYYAGKDFDYLKKYGMVTKGTMVINGTKKYQTLSKEIIDTAIKQALGI